jgi:D-glycero-alpha-D-manno-heptose 1-phosphate guanylyltransferase
LTISDTNTGTGINEKSIVKKGFINCGVYLFTSDFYKRFILCKRLTTFSLEKDVLEDKKEAFLIKAFISDFYFKDIGVPEDYRASQSEFPTLA